MINGINKMSRSAWSDQHTRSEDGMTKREREAIELLDRLYNRRAGHQLDDSCMFEEWLDEEVMAFIRRWGPFADQLREVPDA